MRRRPLLGLVVFALMIGAMLGACREEHSTPVSYVPTPEPPVSPTPAMTPTEDLVRGGMIDARDVTLAFIRLHEPYAALPERLLWEDRITTPEGASGSVDYEFRSGAWVIALERPVAPGSDYRVTVSNDETGFAWRGVVTADGQVHESESPVPEEVKSAHERVVGHLRQDGGLDTLPVNGWSVENVTPKGLVGSATYRFRSGDWVVTMQYPVVPRPNYQVKVWNTTTGFAWEGRAVTSGEVYDTQVEHVEGWEGQVIPLCRMAQFDDFFERDDGERYGIDSVDESIRTELAEAACGRLSVRIWGELLPSAIDARGRQIVVDRLEVLGSPAIPPKEQIPEGPVDGWLGTIRPTCLGAQYDDYLERNDGQRFGVQPASEQVEMAIVEASCDELPVRLWGEMLLADDYDGRRIVVSRIESVR